MMILRWLRDAVVMLAALILPMFADRLTIRRLPAVVFWLLHLILLGLILLGLTALNQALDLPRYLLGPSPILRRYWLPLLYLLMYALCWLGRWLWSLLGPEQELPVFPDIDKAWAEALRALDVAGIDPTEVPLFLVVGRATGGNDALLQGAQIKFSVNRAPADPAAPLFVFANREAVFVTCDGASLLGRQAELLLAGTPADLGGDDGAGEGDSLATIRAERQDNLRAMHDVLAQARQQGRDADNLLDEEKRAIGVIMAGGGDQDDQENVPRLRLLGDRAEVERLTARLRYLCDLIGRSRSPFCPLNGALVVLPIAAAADDESASQTGQITRRDLLAIRDACRVRFPVYVLVGGLEDLTGFHELVSQLPAGQRDRRMGQRFPLVPDLEPPAIPNMIDSGIRWIGDRVFPSLVERLWRVETPSQNDYDQALRDNVRLYHFLRVIHERQRGITRMLTRIVDPEEGPAAMLGGCYFAGTGRNPTVGQAFIAGVFRRLGESQDFVSWTPEGLRRDAQYRRWALSGYIGLGFLVLAALAFAAYCLLT